jgi:hypothetical protein
MGRHLRERLGGVVGLRLQRLRLLLRLQRLLLLGERRLGGGGVGLGVRLGVGVGVRLACREHGPLQLQPLF